MQHAIERVKRPGESQEALDGKKNFFTEMKNRCPRGSVGRASFLTALTDCRGGSISLRSASKPQDRRPRRKATGSGKKKNHRDEECVTALINWQFAACNSVLIDLLLLVICFLAIPIPFIMRSHYLLQPCCMALCHFAMFFGVLVAVCLFLVVVLFCSLCVFCLVGFSVSFCIVTAYWTVYWSFFSTTFAAHHSTR